MIHKLGTIIKNHDQYKYIIQKKKYIYILVPMLLQFFLFLTYVVLVLFKSCMLWHVLSGFCSQT